MDLETYARPHRRLVDERLQALLLSKAATPETLSRAMRYAVLNGGKRFRPLLCLGAAEAVGSTAERALDAACALEMVHCFSLIHDDLPALDNDDLRRGKPTCHVAFGEAIALLAGDALFALAFETLGGMDAPESARFRAMRALAAGTSGMVGGQTLDVECEDKPVEVDTVRWIHSRKTGALIAASCEIGALVGGGPDEQVEACRKCGEKIGLAFQITDDVLNEEGDAASLGKRTQTDRQRKKATFPGVVGLAESKRVACEAAEAAVSELEAFGDCASGLRLLARFAAERSL